MIFLPSLVRREAVASDGSSPAPIGGFEGLIT